MHLQKYQETQKQAKIGVFEEYQSNVLKKVSDLKDLVETRILFVLWIYEPVL